MRTASFALLAASLFASGFVTACADTADVDQADPPSYPDDSEQVQSNPEETAFNFFVQKGLTKDQAAGIVGNLIQESGVSPTIAQYGGGPGRGIAQWSTGGRWDSSSKDNVTWYANQHGVSRWLLTTQLDFIWYELTTYSGYGLASLRASTSVSAATLAFMDKYEICGECASGNRIADANSVLSKFGGGASSGGGGGANSGPDCYSGTLGKNMPDNACVQSKYDDQWYQCAAGDWVDRWSDPDACNGVHPL
jgi:hypothetical protein